MSLLQLSKEIIFYMYDLNHLCQALTESKPGQ